MSSQISVQNITETFEKPQSLEYDIQRPLLVVKNPQIVSEMLFRSEPAVKRMWTTMELNKPYKLVTLNTYSREYDKVKKLFKRTMDKRYTVVKIQRVENPYLLVQYNLKKLQKRNLYGRCTEKELFHGTQERFINSICKSNFDWRLTGSFVTHKFGQGVSFSPNSTYASDYPRNYSNTPRVMFVVNVMKANSCVGDCSMKIPPELYDTSNSPNGNVVVKYEDNDMYPKYVIYYDDT